LVGLDLSTCRPSGKPNPTEKGSKMGGSPDNIIAAQSQEGEAVTFAIMS